MHRDVRIDRLENWVSQFPAFLAETSQACVLWAVMPYEHYGDDEPVRFMHVQNTNSSTGKQPCPHSQPHAFISMEGNE